MYFAGKLLSIMISENNKKEEQSEHTVRDRLSGFGQKVIGEIETVGGILTGDPATRAEGEYNIEVGELREDIAEDLERSRREDAGEERKNDERS